MIRGVRDLPTGTVTFLFTDIEGSTRLLQELGAEAYGAALDEHRLMLREAFAQYGGVEVDTQGDAFFVAFATAPGALAAAREGQAALAGGAIRVRMGLHTGTPLVTAEGYVGPDVNRAARIAAAGHGGQVLLSRSTRDLVEGQVRDLGEHRLKDLSAPERLYQVGEAEFPPLKTLYRTNLPVPATTFLGRERELAEVGDWLAREDVRLLTLIGPGGTGKTRLALQAAGSAAEAYPGGVFWVPLAPLHDPALVLDSAANAIGGDGALAEQVADRRTLILLDNLEHLIDAARELPPLLGSCPGLDLLVTSRELLRVAGEQAYPVPSLADEEAVELFLARARAVQPAFAGNGRIPELCRRLDNLPLAVELAAARTRVFSPEELHERLSQRLDFLKAGRDSDPRQQTLRATIEWSHDLLEEAERTLFRRLVVFAGGCTLEAVERICESDPETLVSLVDQSLVRRREDGRFWMLETILELAAEKLEGASEAEAVRRRHAEHFAELADGLGLCFESLSAGGGQRYDLALPERDNFRAAIDWAQDADPQLALRLAASLENFWVTQSAFEGRHRLEALLDQVGNVPVALRAKGLRCLGNTVIFMEDRESGVRKYEEAFELYTQAGDERGIALMQHRIGINSLWLGDAPRARELIEASVAGARTMGLDVLEAQALGSLGSLEHREGNAERGLELVRQSAELARSTGFTWWEIQMLAEASEQALDLGRLDEANEDAAAALALSHRINDRRVTVVLLAGLAEIAARLGEGERAGRLWGAVEAELARAPLGSAEKDLDEMSARIVPEIDREFEHGREAGARLTLDEAVAEVVGHG
jgi:predicted ATPase/class 3 adenylate cyclase